MDITNFFIGCEKLKTFYASPDLVISDPDNYKTAKYARIDGGPSNPGYFTAK